MSFHLIPGVFIPDISGLDKTYRMRQDKIIFSLSAEDYNAFWIGTVRLMKDPVFFFVEIPSDNDEYKTYYLDNCTKPVARAILKRYGGILFCDGVIRWGFGSHSTDDEVYMREYQTAEIYSKSPEEYKGLLGRIGYHEDKKSPLAWDILSVDNPGECVNVEVEDETYIEMVNNLTEAGLHD